MTAPIARVLLVESRRVEAVFVSSGHMKGSNSWRRKKTTHSTESLMKAQEKKSEKFERSSGSREGEQKPH